VNAIGNGNGNGNGNGLLNHLRKAVDPVSWAAAELQGMEAPRPALYYPLSTTELPFTP
jgi:hypothetical protein